MRKLLALSLLLTPIAAQAQGVYVQPHVRSDGTYVQGHWRSSPNSTRSDNWSTRPNINPYNGRVGTNSPYPTTPSYPSYPTKPKRYGY